MRNNLLRLACVLAIAVNASAAQAPNLPEPGDVNFSVRTKGDQSTFHIGELITTCLREPAHLHQQVSANAGKEMVAG